MHDIHRASLIADGKKRKAGKSGSARAQANHAHSHDHDHDMPHGHSHDHAEDAYEEHDRDLHRHDHEHEHEEREDRAFAHIHEHGHDFFHAHHHTHHPEHVGVVHRIFNDPVRDWFAAFLMVMLIAAGYFQWLPGHLSEGMVVCAAVIGIFPLLKNAFFNLLYWGKFCFELPAGVVLLAGLFTGRSLAVALIALLLLTGSFMRLNFSWKD